MEKFYFNFFRLREDRGKVIKINKEMVVLKFIVKLGIGYEQLEQEFLDIKFYFLIGLLFLDYYFEVVGVVKMCFF